MKNNFFIKPVILAIIIIPVIFFTPNKSLALDVQSNSLFVQPGKVNITADPGQKLRQSLTVVNKSSSSVFLKILVKDVKPAGQNGEVEFYDSKDSSAAANWLIPQYTTIAIGPLGAQNVDYIISADPKMDGKGYNGAIIFQMYENDKLSDKKFGMIVDLNVINQGITTGGIIKNFSFPKFQLQNNLLKTGFNLKNLGNSNLSMAGNIAFIDIFGKKVAQFNTSQMDVYPGSEKNFNFAWTDTPLFGVYKVQASLWNLMKKGNEAEYSSWVVFLPWHKLVFGALGGIFASLIIVFGAKFIYGYAKKKKILTALKTPF